MQLCMILTIMSTLLLFIRNAISDKLARVILTLYLLWWTLWLGLSSFNLYKLFSVSDLTYCLLLLSISMFCLGYLFCGTLSSQKIDNLKSINYNPSIHSGLFRILFIITVIILYYYLKYRGVVLSGVSSNNRLERFVVGNVFSSAKELLFFNYFIEAFIDAAIIIFAYMIIYGRFKNISFLFITMSIALYAGFGSGRGPIIDVLIAMGLLFFIRSIESKRTGNIQNEPSKNYEVKKFKKKNLIFLAIISVIIIGYSAWLTASRLGLTHLTITNIQIGFNELFEQFIIYFTGPFRALDYGIKNYDIGLLLGRGTFAGIDELINLAFNLIGITYSSASGIIGDLLQTNQIDIGNGYLFNFAYTNVMIFYFDFGIAGVVIFPFLYGFFVRKAIILYEYKPTIPTLVIMAFLFVTMINSVFKWGLQSPSSLIVLVASYIWYKFECREGNNNKFWSSVIVKEEH